MAKGKLSVICMSGGKFTSNDDGSLSYTGGDAHAMSINNETKFNEFKSEIADMWDYDPNFIIIKYFLSNNNRTPITISRDKDIQHMLDFHEDSASVDVYVMTGGDIGSVDVSDNVTMGEPVTPVDVPMEADAGDHIEQHKWKNSITGLHQQFENVKDFRIALQKYSIAYGFDYEYKNNDKRRVTVNCKTEGCPWRIHASKLSTTQPLFSIKKMNETHTCGAGSEVTSSARATMKLVVDILTANLQKYRNCKYKKIADDIQRDFGIKLSYLMVYRGMKTVLETAETLNQLQRGKKTALETAETLNQLHWFCEKMVEANPGSVVNILRRDGMSFHGIFVAFRTSIDGFLNCCRPLLLLYTLELHSQHGYTMLCAMAMDGKDECFPVASAVVDEVNDDNWLYFLAQLKSALSTSESISFAPYSFSERTIRKLVYKIFKNSQWLSFKTAQKRFGATTTGIHWELTMFLGRLSIIESINAICNNQKELINERQVRAEKWESGLIASVGLQLAFCIDLGSSLPVEPVPNSSGYIVKDSEKLIFNVDIDGWKCGCEKWGKYRLPCVHAVAVIQHIGGNVGDYYCSKYFMTETYRLTYSGSINSIPIPIPIPDKP